MYKPQQWKKCSTFILNNFEEKAPKTLYYSWPRNHNQIQNMISLLFGRRPPIARAPWEVDHEPHHPIWNLTFCLFVELPYVWMGDGKKDEAPRVLLKQRLLAFHLLDAGNGSRLFLYFHLQRAKEKAYRIIHNSFYHFRFTQNGAQPTCWNPFSVSTGSDGAWFFDFMGARFSLFETSPKGVLSTAAVVIIFNWRIDFSKRG